MLTSSWETTGGHWTIRRKLTRYWSRSCLLMTTISRHPKHKWTSSCSYQYSWKRQRQPKSQPDPSDRIKQRTNKRPPKHRNRQTYNRTRKPPSCTRDLWTLKSKTPWTNGSINTSDNSIWTNWWRNKLMRRSWEKVSRCRDQIMRTKKKMKINHEYIFYSNIS